MKNRKKGNVTQLENEFTQTKTVQAHRETKYKKQKKRRIAAIVAISSVFIVGLSSNLVKNTQVIAGLDDQKVASAEELKEVEQRQETLQDEVKKLEDDDYIAKLARSQYYLSQEGEIIFSFPEDNAAKTQEKSKENADTAESEENQSASDE
ncbi:septum formation initiator family protein [Desemzia sp. RIT804]|uniref:FtsB family cell division protein n=1 Tax=Desemzia sp. RIT 804 TaxID=2810209 RepID=UPI001950B5D4|nr:septum formation initiator family protein [Desemzia sp. RIT 804]MBM6615386.1 septum formation initiator family protein [Desemzia sp. RIT 804]